MIKKLLKKLAQALIFVSIFSFFCVFTYVIHSFNNLEINLQKLLVCNNRICKAFFSPDDNLQSILINLIKCEKKRLLIAIYTITQKEIAQELINAFARGVKIECVVDKSYGSDRFSKVSQLANKHIPIWVYQSDEIDNGLMHNKFCIFEENVCGKSILWTGSYNFTNRANKSNQENVVIFDDTQLIEKFLNQFEVLKNRAVLISGSKKISITNSSKAQTSELYLFFNKILNFLNKMLNKFFLWLGIQ